MRVCVHDHCGHPFPVELSRWLARCGHSVLHLYAPAVEAPRGRLAQRPGDPRGLKIEAVPMPGNLAKYRPARRYVQERAYARRAGRHIAAFAPDVVLSGNCSALVQRRLQLAAHRHGAAFVYWLQDIYGLAVKRALARRMPRLAPVAGRVVDRVEGAALTHSDAVVAITADFVPAAVGRGVPPERVHVVPNWAPVAELTPERPDAGARWRLEHGLGRRFLFLYAGTLGLKHEPQELAALARAHRDDPDVAVVVIGQGPGRATLERVRAAEGLANLVLLDFVPLREMPAVMAAADVLVAMLTPEAGSFSVPSKVLTYLCGGRPVLAAMPPGNAAARTLHSAGAGVVVEPGREDAWLAAAEALRRDPDRRARLGAAGRAYADRAFAMDRIGPRFVEVFERAASADPTPADTSRG